MAKRYSPENDPQAIAAHRPPGVATRTPPVQASLSEGEALCNDAYLAMRPCS